MFVPEGHVYGGQYHNASAVAKLCKCKASHANTKATKSMNKHKNTLGEIVSNMKTYSYSK